MFVPVLLTLAALMLEPRPDAEGHERASDRAGRRCGASSFCCWPTRCCSACWAARCSRAICCPCIRWCCWWPSPPSTGGCPTGRRWRSFPRRHFVAGAVHQSALRLCAGRQPGLRARGPAAAGRDCAAEQALSGRDGALGLARDRRADPPGAWLREAALGRVPPSTTSPRRRSPAPPTSRKSTPRRWSSRPSTTRRRCFEPGREERGAGRALLWPAPRSAAGGDRDAAGRTRWCGRSEDQGMWIALIRFDRVLAAQVLVEVCEQNDAMRSPPVEARPHRRASPRRRLSIQICQRIVEIKSE